ncbi:MAG: GNAT family N-acetyltransferase [Gemmatimonadales bacterium]|jgi:ribosomal protein S18 acetylase RimI-like enzyme
MIREFRESDAESTIALWRTTEWASVSEADSPKHIAKFLARNPGCSWVAEERGVLVGTVLCGHDARRGYIYHLVVDAHRRESGIGRDLLEKALDSLRSHGVAKCHAIVLDGNPAAELFWTRLGWQKQPTSQYSMLL